MDSATTATIRHARSAAPYFTELYSKLPADLTLEHVPVVDHASYWAASVGDPSLVMTGPHLDGVVMRTGGTTSRPKVTAYSQAELQRTASLLAQGLLAGGVRAGDRIANMFYAGSLYASFLLHVVSIMALPVPVVHVPIGGPIEAAEAVDLVRQSGSTVLLTTATSLVKMAHYITGQDSTINEVRCVLFGGEPLFPEQDEVIRRAFPRAIVKSCIYGSVDAGVLATAAPGDDPRLHRALMDTVKLEIVQDDDANTVIQEPGVPGILVATNTLRQLCPVIRYPTGDRAAWVDQAKGLFMLLGRASQAVRLGPVSVDMADLRSIVAGATKNLGTGQRVLGVQAVISRADGLDQLQCDVALDPALALDDMASAALTGAILSELYRQRPMLREHVDLGLVAPAIVRLVAFSDLALSNGSYKVRDVVETRFGNDAKVPLVAIEA